MRGRRGRWLPGGSDGQQVVEEGAAVVQVIIMGVEKATAAASLDLVEDQVLRRDGEGEREGGKGGGRGRRGEVKSKPTVLTAIDRRHLGHYK